MNGIVVRAGRVLVLVGALSCMPGMVAAQDKDAPATAEKITDKSHPDYIRCRSEEIIGSRAQFRRVCRTNKQWADISARGGGAARDALNRASTVGGLIPQ
jgi:hypothetical protein